MSSSSTESSCEADSGTGSGDGEGDGSGGGDGEWKRGGIYTAVHTKVLRRLTFMYMKHAEMP